MSLTNFRPQQVATTFTVDELEAKIDALHDYLSTPYRARAQAILQQRRQRERGLIESASTSTTPMEPHARMLFGAAEDARSTNATAPLHMQDSSVPLKERSASHVAPQKDAQVQEQRTRGSPTASLTAIGDSPAMSLFTDSESRAEAKHSSAATSSTKRVAAEPASPCEAAEDSTPCAAEGQCEGVNPELEARTQRRIERLEWQVQMLSDALQQERDRLLHVQERVVGPLQEIAEASLRRQVELEWELSQLRGNKL